MPAIVDAHAGVPFDLAQMLIQRAAQVRQALIVGRFQQQLVGGGVNSDAARRLGPGARRRAAGPP